MGAPIERGKTLGDEVRNFLSQPAYEERKKQRFRTGDERVVARNPAFMLTDQAQRRRFAVEYEKTSALYYRGQPAFGEVLARIDRHLEAM